MFIAASQRPAARKSIHQLRTVVSTRCSAFDTGRGEGNDGQRVNKGSAGSKVRIKGESGFECPRGGLFVRAPGTFEIIDVERNVLVIRPDVWILIAPPWT